MSLTPTLKERNQSRKFFIQSLINDAVSFIFTHPHNDLHRHDRLSIHPNPSVRIKLLDDRRASYEIGHRYLLLKKRISALDLSKAADWAVFQSVGNYPNGDWWNLKKPLSTAFKKYGTLPVVNLTDDEAAEWAYETTVHDIDEAMRVQLDQHFGATWDFVALGIDDLSNDDIAIARVVKRRWKELRDRTTLPDNPNDPTLWGRDTALNTLTVTPKIGTAVVLTPSFSRDVFHYTMEYRGDQILRTDAIARDINKAKSVEILEKHRVIRRVTSEVGDVQDYIVEGNSECYLSELEFGNTGYLTPYPYTPTFNKKTLNYVTTAPILGVRQFKDAFTTKGATGRVIVGPTHVDFEVTAADGKTKRTYRITSSHGG